jgi:peptide deformylase
MAIFEVVKVGEPVLREKAKPVKDITSNIIKLLKNMTDTMYEAPGVGLAAPQIGISKRVVVIDIGEGLLELINPEIIASEGTEVDLEGCLSIPGVSAKVKRSLKVKVQALNPKGHRVEIEGEGMLARALQHEIDHLDGILFIDRVEKP